MANAPTSGGPPARDARDCANSSAAGDNVLKDIEARVQRLLGSRIRDFQIIAARDGLILKGSSNSWYVKQLAQHAVMEAVRIGIWSNEIVVEEWCPFVTPWNVREEK
ncbi:MAG TPA: hypothetical protein VKE94_04330 [Gemmataceae bacterium]|nr:hypothetical protein [Gemmataceae bacterium]